MREYTSEELIIIGLHHALKSERERLQAELYKNRSSMSAVDLTDRDGPDRLLGLLLEATHLVRAFQEIEPDYQDTVKAYREAVADTASFAD